MNESPLEEVEQDDNQLNISNPVGKSTQRDGMFQILKLSLLILCFCGVLLALFFVIQTRNSFAISYSSFDVSRIEIGRDCSVFGRIDATLIANELLTRRMKTSDYYRRSGLSGYGEEEYECHGTCYCNDEGGRRNAISTISRAFSMTVLSVSTVAAFNFAKNRLDEKCRTNIFEEEDCLVSNIESDVEDCSPVSTFFDDVEFSSSPEHVLADTVTDILTNMKKQCFEVYPITINSKDYELLEQIKAWFEKSTLSKSIDWVEGRRDANTDWNNMLFLGPFMPFYVLLKLILRAIAGEFGFAFGRYGSLDRETSK